VKEIPSIGPEVKSTASGTETSSTLAQKLSSRIMANVSSPAIIGSPANLSRGGFLRYRPSMREERMDVSNESTWALPTTDGLSTASRAFDDAGLSW
jgi:hypothetical protein